jgi:hypothetical protein
MAAALVHVRYRYLRRRIRRIGKALLVNALIRFIRFRQWITLFTRRCQAQLLKGVATLVALLLILVLNCFFSVPSDLKAGELSLASATIIGAALALVLSISIIPAQRAAEAFSPAILNLYARDRALLLVFFTLVTTTMLSVLLGAGWVSLDARYSISIELILLGISFDALRSFYVRTLSLLVPQTAVRLVLRECSAQLAGVQRIVERFVRVLKLAGGAADHEAISRALLYAKSNIARALRGWIAELDEFAHKAIARRDMHGANEIISAMGMIGQQYTDTRSSSLILMPDWDHPFAGGVTDISEVLNPILESIRAICQDAATAPNEPVARHCIRTLEAMTTHAMQVIHAPDGRWRTAPLAYSPCFYLGMCVKIAIRAGMADAVLAAIDSLQTILLKKTTEIDTRTVEPQALDTLFTILVASYAKQDSVWAFPAMKAMLIGARHDLQIRGYQHLPELEDALGHALAVAPFEVQMEKAGMRRLQTFPPYDLGFEGNIAMLLDIVAGQVKVDPERRWINPFHEFVEASEDIVHHFRDLARVNFENTLLRKWVIDTILTVAQVHLSLLTHPPEGSEDHLDDVDNRIQWVIHSVSPFFPENQAPFHYHHAQDACGGLAILGMQLLQHNRRAAALSCGTAIAAVAANGAATTSDAYGLADVQEKIEMLARAAEALGDADAATAYREMIQRPPEISDAEWSYFMEARGTRIGQLDRRLREIERYPRGLPGDPVPLLRRILEQAQRQGC